LESDIVSAQFIASIFGVEAGGIAFLATGLNASYHRILNKKYAVLDIFQCGNYSARPFREPELSLNRKGNDWWGVGRLYIGRVQVFRTTERGGRVTAVFNMT